MSVEHKQLGIFGSNVQPTRRTRPKPRAWACCGRQIGGHWKFCPECRKPRP